MKQETIEEAAEKEYPTIHEQYQYDAFIEGAKWQQKKDIKELKPNPLLMDEVGHWDFRRQRSYSEEDLKYAYEQGKLYSHICYSRTFENVLEIIKIKKK